MQNEWITSNPGVLGGKPVIRGTRVSVAFVLKLLSAGWTMDQIMENYPHLTKEGILSALEYASRVLDGQWVVPVREEKP
ncbi:MAG: DUF433 domain-containing protein [Deltaproteobacteria bacterium]|nr:DUF433 domain-containing protein [Deltaproteobacteria bacterium]MBW2306089.1 DUF433 domain-containing protein [Deltaproteobacteria bacterium]